MRCVARLRAHPIVAPQYMRACVVASPHHTCARPRGATSTLRRIRRRDRSITLATTCACPSGYVRSGDHMQSIARGRFFQSYFGHAHQSGQPSESSQLICRDDALPLAPPPRARIEKLTDPSCRGARAEAGTLAAIARDELYASCLVFTASAPRALATRPPHRARPPRWRHASLALRGSHDATHGVARVAPCCSRRRSEAVWSCGAADSAHARAAARAHASRWLLGQLLTPSDYSRRWCTCGREAFNILTVPLTPKP